jgi:biopolymer transport protein ExbD
MLKRPSRKNSHSDSFEVNLVPILDTMVTIIGFLLFTTSFLSIVSLETLFPQASSEEVQNKIQEKPLQLTLSIEDKQLKLWSPFQKIEPKTIPNTQEGKPDLKALHEQLMEIKKNFPFEKTLVFIPYTQFPYDHLIGVMDATRFIESSDPPLYAKNPVTGNDESLKELFPIAVFGNLLEES